MSADLDAFFAQADGLCHTDYWGEVSRLWRDAGPAARGDARWRRVWDQARLAPGSDLGLMTDEERAALAELPDPLVLARGPDAPELAWRLVGDGAAGAAVTAQAPRDRVVALLLGDGTPELIVLPDDVEPVTA